MTESTNPGSPARRTTEDERSDALDALGQTLGTAPNVVRHAYGDDADQFVEVHGDPATASAVVADIADDAPGLRRGAPGGLDGGARYHPRRGR